MLNPGQKVEITLPNPIVKQADKVRVYTLHSNEDGETLEGFYNRINLDRRRRKILEDTKKKNDVTRQM
ncbi:MAG: hypothetical protein WCC17_08425 [Candidatus Nitrosopolaris sp.]